MSSVSINYRSSLPGKNIPGFQIFEVILDRLLPIILAIGTSSFKKGAVTYINPDLSYIQNPNLSHWVQSSTDRTDRTFRSVWIELLLEQTNKAVLPDRKVAATNLLMLTEILPPLTSFFIEGKECGSGMVNFQIKPLDERQIRFLANQSKDWGAKLPA